MRKSFFVAITLLCVMAVTGCGREAPENSEGSYRKNASNPSVETAPPDAGTDDSSDTGSVDAAPPEEEQTAPATVAAYLSAAETLWRSDQEHVDYRMAFGNVNLDQRREVNLEQDYNCEIILPEDFAETWNFTLSLSVDGTPDNLYVLEGNRDYVSIVFGYAYKLDNTLYIGTGSSDCPPFALNLETKALTDCKKESEILQNLYADWLQGQPENLDLRIQYYYPIARVDGCLIYLATISEAMDTDTRAVIYAAFDESRSLRAYLLLTEADYLPPSNVTIAEQTDVAMEIRKISPSGGSITIRNTGEKTIGYGEQYVLEKNMGGTWYSLNMIAPEEKVESVWTDILYTLESGNEITLKLQWDSFYGLLPAGNYRLVKNISYPDHAGGKENFNVAAYFEIE